jgi:UDP-GlcNAc:undecaprenyl-phosphate GlcNAc-1-phosphate transferase
VFISSEGKTVIDYFFEVLSLTSIEVTGLFIIFFCITLFWKNIYQSLSLKPYESTQRLHQDEVPRIGGLIIYIFLIFATQFSFHAQLLNIILISAIPIIFIGTKEDLLHNTSPKIRLIFMILSASLFIFLLPIKLPEIDLPIVSKILSFTFVKEAFFIFSILVIMNGNNLIDGVNGNMALTNIVQLSVLASLAFTFNDNELMQISFILLIPLFIFFIFNYPFGKIFSGDAGAYFYGFSVSALVIYLFGMYDHLLSWGAVLILIYPSIELLFSFTRKIFFENTSPFSPDAKHLHSLIFCYLNKKFNCFNNSFVVLFLIPFIYAPFMANLFIDDIIGLLLTIFIAFILYVTMYLFFLNLISKK